MLDVNCIASEYQELMGLTYMGLTYAGTLFVVSMTCVVTASATELVPSTAFTVPDAVSTDRVGSSVAISDRYVVLGAYGDDEKADEAGAAYVFDRETGQLLHKMTAEDAVVRQQFGRAVAIGSESVLATSPLPNSATDSGAAYLFDIATGKQIAKLLPDVSGQSDLFGIQAEIDGGIAAVSALYGREGIGRGRGEVYLYDSLNGSPLGVISPDTSDLVRSFGTEIDIDNNLLIAGYYDSKTGAGAHVYDLATLEEISRLSIDPTRELGHTPVHVAIDDNLALVSSSQESINGLDQAGAAYVFDATTGGLISKLQANDPQIHDRFGSSVTIENGIAIITASGGIVGDPQDPTIYLFDAVTGQQLARIDESAFYNQGYHSLWYSALASEDGVALIGSYGDYGGIEYNGAAIAFEVSHFTIPEPSSCLMIALACSLMAIRRLRSRRTSRP